MTDKISPPSDAGKNVATRPGPATRRIRSADLLQDGRALIILHNEQEYHLRITRLGKLILTK